jgi:hypothetical protein
MTANIIVLEMSALGVRALHQIRTLDLQLA